MSSAALSWSSGLGGFSMDRAVVARPGLLQFDDFAQPFLRRDRRDHQAGVLQLVLIVGVELVAVAVAFVDAVVLPLRGRRPGCRRRGSIAGTEAHGGAHVLDALLLFLQADDGMRGGLVELGGVRALRGRRRCGRTRWWRSACRGRCRSRGCLFSRAYWAARILPSMPRSPKPPGTRMPSTSPMTDFGAVVLDVLGVDPDDVDLGVVVRHRRG